MHFFTSRSKRRPLSVVVCALIVSLLSTALAAAPGGVAAGATTSTSRLADYTYDLVTAKGNVKTFGGAAWWGSTAKLHLNAPIIGMSVLTDGLGYWLGAADGGVFTFGAAKFYGSLGAKKLPRGDHIIDIAADRTGGGYWLFDSDGVATAFGNARPLGALPPADVSSPIVAASVNAAGTGAWLTNAAGDVFTLGAAKPYGSLAGQEVDVAITAIAATPDGGGYWLSSATGWIYSFGDAAKSRPAPQRMLGKVVSMVPARDELGFWATTQDGWVLPGGDAPPRGGVNGYVDGSPVVGIAASPRWDGRLPGSTNPYPPGSVGYDVNWPQCAASGSSQVGSMPGPPNYPAGSEHYSIAVVGVDGWAVDDNNTCLSAEVKWAKAAEYPSGDGSGTPPYELYLFLNSPAPTSTIDQSGPAGTCSSFTGTKWADCLTYNYGYNSGALAARYATSQGASAKIWWLDVENAACAPGIYNDSGNGEFWSCNTSLNDKTIEGAIDALRAKGVTPGIYSTAQQYAGIAGSFVPNGAQVPIWIAGAYWTSPPYPASDHYSAPSANAPYCAASKNPYAFAGGKVQLLQETPGPNDYPFDPDYSC